MPGATRSRTISILAASLLLGILSLPAQAQIRLDLPAQSLGTSLTAVGTLGHLNVMFDPSVVDGLQAQALKADLSAEDALGKLLSGTKLHAIRVDSNTIRVMAEPSHKRAQGSDASKTGATYAHPSLYLAYAATEPDDTGDQIAPMGSSESTPSPHKANRIEVDEVVVTGTHIRDAPPASPIIEITRQDIEASGYSSTSQLFESLPQNFGIGGPNYNAAKGNSGQGYEPGASRPNLRGLGDATLVLVNSHRIARTGTGNSYDVSTIPVVAIDHIEIVTDGASAIYGADAVAGVVNIILKKDFEGIELGALGGWTSDGGGAEQQYNATAGRNWTSGNALVSYTYSTQRPIFSNERDFSPASTPTSLTPKIHMTALTAQINQRFSSAFSAHADALYANRSVQDSLAADPSLWYDTLRSTEQYTIDTGVVAELPRNWQLTVGGGYSRSRSRGAQLDTATATSAVTAAHPFGLTQSQYELESQANGTIATIYSGDIKLAVGAGYRREILADSSIPGTDFSAARNIEYGYAETQIPLVSDDSTRTGLERLELSASERYDHYSDVGGRADGKLGIVYKPVRDVTLRATWATAFRAPALENVYEPGYFYLFLLPDAGATTTLTAYTYGYGNKGLKAETSESWSLTLDYTPAQIHDLSLSTTAFHYDFRNKVALPIPTFDDILTNPLYNSFVIRNPSQSLLGGYAASAVGGVQNFVGPGGVLSAVQALALDNPVNLTKWISEGADLTVKYSIDTAAGGLDFMLGGTYLNVTQQAAASAPQISVAGTIFNPPRFKARGGFIWRLREWQLSSFTNYVGTESDDVQVPHQHIASFTTADLSAAYSLRNDGAWSSGWMFRATVLNAFNHSPPHVAVTTPFYPLGYDGTNASPVGRMITFELAKRW